jgi:type II secretory pathway pseudopilin PulG
MIAAAVLFIAKLFARPGSDLSKIQRYVAIGLVVIGLLTLLAAGLSIRSCVSRHRADHALKVEQQTVAKINSANEQEKRQALQQVITENDDVVKTVDQRTAIAESDEATRQLAINQKIDDADEKIAQAKAQGKDVSSAELECILVPDHCQQKQ